MLQENGLQFYPKTQDAFQHDQKIAQGIMRDYFRATLLVTMIAIL